MPTLPKWASAALTLWVTLGTLALTYWDELATNPFYGFGLAAAALLLGVKGEALRPGPQ